MLNNKFWQGFFALAPLVSLILLIFGYLFFIILAIGGDIGDNGHMDEVHGLLMGGIAFFIIVVLLVVLISFASLVFYIVHAAKNPNLQGNNMLVVWILLFLFANGLGQLIYWIIEILNKKEGAEVKV
ncbi:hypothetical protein [Zeaxanthinibacter enoshimensis]|uniref:hypothetical protein n=1 Tax=Zeaxanthinibacter enoshimensis TaxID=392009 RepID=UPI0035669A53